MRVALSGATGFIGQHVLAELRRWPVSIVALTRDPARLFAAPGVEVLALDIAAPGADAFEQWGRPDVLIHLAWGGLPNYRSLTHFERELPLQYRFLSSLVRAGLPALLVTGTCLEYGLQEGCLAESAPTEPVSAYGLAKDALRRALELLRTEQPFALTWARLFYTHGAGQPASSLLPQLRAAVARGDAQFNMSGGAQLRDYLPVTSVARLIVELALAHPDGGLVNVCSGQPVSVRELVEGWLAANQWRIALNLGHYPYADYEPTAFWGDRRRLQALLERTAG